MLRHSSRRQRLDRSFLAARLQGARGYDRIAGYFSSSLLELVGEELETFTGKMRVVCNSDLHPQDILTAQAAKWRCGSPGPARSPKHFSKPYLPL